MWGAIKSLCFWGMFDQSWTSFFFFFCSLQLQNIKYWVMVVDDDKVWNKHSRQLYVFASKQEQKCLLKCARDGFLKQRKLLSSSIQAYNIIYYNLKLSGEDYRSQELQFKVTPDRSDATSQTSLIWSDLFWGGFSFSFCGRTDPVFPVCPSGLVCLSLSLCRPRGPETRNSKKQVMIAGNENSVNGQDTSRLHSMAQ